MNEDLLAAAQKLYNAGWTIIGSQGKSPNLHKWKGVERAEMYQYALANIRMGRANSLTLRLDSDLAAIDCDFHDEQCTAAFVAFWEMAFGKAVTCVGSKGCKIFCRLHGKEGVGSTVYLMRDMYRPFVDWTNEALKKDASNAVELKQELSTFYGQHSEDVTYGVYPDTLSLLDVTPEALPVVTADQIKDICKSVEEFYCLVPWGGLKVAPEHVLAARRCIGLIAGDTDLERQIMADGALVINSSRAQTLEEFLRDYGHGFEADCVHTFMRPGEVIYSKYYATIKALLTDVKEHGAEPSGAALRLLDITYRRDASHMMQELILHGYDASQVAHKSFLDLYAAVMCERELDDVRSKIA